VDNSMRTTTETKLQPTIQIVYGEHSFSLNSLTTEIPFMSLFPESLFNLCQALQTRFSITNDICLYFPSLDLKIDMNATYAEEFTLSYVYDLHQSLFLSQSFTAIIKEKKSSFLSQYNYLLTQLPSLVTDRDDAEYTPESNLTLFSSETADSNHSEEETLSSDDFSLLERTDDHPLLLLKTSPHSSVSLYETNPYDSSSEPQEDVDFIPSDQISLPPATLEASLDLEDFNYEFTNQNGSELVSSADLTEGDYETHYSFTKSRDVGEEEEEVVGDEGVDEEDFDILGYSDDDSKQQSVGDYGVGVGNVGMGSVRQGECSDETIGSTNQLTHPLLVNHRLEIIESDEGTLSELGEQIITHDIEDESPKVIDESDKSLSTGKRKYTNSETDESLNFKRSRRTNSYDELDNEFRITYSPDSVVIYVNDIEEEGDNEVDLGQELTCF